ncbi:hypothetical protein KDU71_13870 [Carboxylicivirga sediminis]|uniref:Glycoside hydrolase family 2 n=1 Tax=Carboxylicivirga sediminis TaxID=2006564 RepID=A0A941F4F9_9BACT|nr:sugar-binding domain-containing protein [Carboxylicivirga sediminis]MBR8536658.1 hypothetical protein [Carboxylicivirga sediminis]
MSKIFVIIISLLISSCLYGQHKIDLKGVWNVRLDPANELIAGSGKQNKTTGQIKLPGSLAENGYGLETKGSDFGVLTPTHKYIGKAWYTRTITIPKAWKGKQIELTLERVLWQSKVYVDGKELDVQDALGTAHIHCLGTLSPGEHELTVLVDNDMIFNIGDKGHAYGEYTQSIWNGIVGRIEMKAYDHIKVQELKTYSDLSKDKLELKVKLHSALKSKASVSYEILSVNTGELVLSGESEQFIVTGTNDFNINVDVAGKLQKWSEFTPETYTLKLKVLAGKNQDVVESEFGFCEVGHDGTHLLINDVPIFLRGNLDCVHFPQTGYVSCELEDWMRIFQKYKDYGLNHARFHSWCPPEAAFRAANRVGIYLQAEASIWIDWWMSEDMTERGRPEMNTKGFPKGLGHDSVRDSFVVAEMNRVVDVYGNHPSFTMFCIGNELGNSDFKVMEHWISDLKNKDTRRLYAASTARTITKADDYCATHYIPNVGGTRGLKGAHTDWDFEDVYSQMDIPIIAHEIGQWPVYPQWKEIERYTGVLKARNLMEFKEEADKNGIADQDYDFAMASGALNQLLYKYETESFLRTKSCAGVQLLSMQDYQGQGEALIGWLDANWESKGIVTPKKFKEHFNTTVPLLRMKKFVWSSSEQFDAKAQLAHYGDSELIADCLWEVKNSSGQIIKAGMFNNRMFSIGSLSELGKINFNLNEFDTAEKLTVSIFLEGTEYRNSWDIWVYPEIEIKGLEGDVYVTAKLDELAKDVLDKGGKVLLLAHQLGVSETSVTAGYYPLYWSLTFFPGQGKTNLGLLLQNEHPAFTSFPTSFHSDWQWETISKDSKGFILSELPIEYKPIAQPVDDFHRNNKIGSIFELKVGEGSLLVCGYNLNSRRPVAKQLKKSLLDYMNSVDFSPSHKVSYQWLQQLLPYVPKAEAVELPEEFDNAILYVNASAKVRNEDVGSKWEREFDEVILADKADYEVKAGGVWKDDVGSAWFGENMEIQINCPAGILGTLYVHFHDWNKLNRTGIVDFEGRKVKLDKHSGEGQWVKFHVMREDSNDGKLVLKSNVETGPNLMITKIVLTRE